VYVLAMEVEIRIPDAQSLKDKRTVVKPLLDGARRRYSVSAAEVARQDDWQRAVVGFAVVTSAVHLAESVMDDVDRFVWSHPELEVVRAERSWLG
jgi:uncharacterized protein YlxP (DUF503 family)